MTSSSLADASTTLLGLLLHPAARALALAVVAGIGLTAFRARSTSIRLFTWNAVLCTALAMPLLWWMLPPVAVPMPAFLRQKALSAGELRVRDNASYPVRMDQSGTSKSAPVVARQTTSTIGASAALKTFRCPSIDWKVGAAGLYLLGALVLALRFVVGIAYCRRLLRESRTINEPRLMMRLASRVDASGLTVIPEARESELLCVPVTMGAMRSAILLPADWREWSDSKLDAVVAHEVSHVARRDALTQRLSLLHRAIFWFSPLSWWLDKHLADLAEQASDEAALSSGIKRTEYARTLLGFFEALQAAPGRVWWQGVSMAKAGQAEERVDKILAWKGNVAMSLKKPVLAFVVLLVLPLTYLAASVHLSSDGSAPQQVTPADQPQAVNPVHPAEAVTNVAPSSPVREVHIYRVDSNSNLVAFASDEQGKNGTKRHRAMSDGDDEVYAIISGNSNDVTMSGSSEDVKQAQDLKKSIAGDFIWFRRGGRSYVIRDQATVDRAKKFWAEQEALGKQQDELGEKQEELGKQQEELGTRMEKVEVKVPDMTAQLDKLKAELQQMNSSATMEQVSKIQEEIGELQEKIGEIQSQAGEEQSKLGDKMSALGEKQSKLGEEQGKLGEKQEELARIASQKMKQLIDEAMAKGTAQAQQ